MPEQKVKDLFNWAQKKYDIEGKLKPIDVLNNLPACITQVGGTNQAATIIELEPGIKQEIADYAGT